MAERLRVAVVARAVAPAHGLGGLERHVFDVVQHLRARDVSVTLITRTGARDCEWPPTPTGRGSLDVEEVPYLTFPLAGRRGTTILDRDTAYPLFGWRAGQRARNLVGRGRVDVVYGLGASVFGYAVARRAGRADARAPLVFNPQGLEEFGATNPTAAPLKRLAYWPLQRVVRACARGSDRIIATDRVLAPVVRQHLGVNEDTISVVPNAVDLARCDGLGVGVDLGGLRRRHGIGDSHRLLVSVGRLEENKGFHILLDALARLQTTMPWTAVIIGEGPWRRELERRLAARNLGHRAKLIGRVSDDELHAWYRAATVFVHPTLYEGSSLVTLEAMAHGLPVVASAAGGLPDKVFPRRNGWLVPPGEADDLTHALSEALSAPSLGGFGEYSRKLVEREFAWPSVVDQLIAVFRDVQEGSAGRVG